MSTERWAYGFVSCCLYLIKSPLTYLQLLQLTDDNIFLQEMEGEESKVAEGLRGGAISLGSQKADSKKNGSAGSKRRRIIYSKVSFWLQLLPKEIAPGPWEKPVGRIWLKIGMLVDFEV